MRIACSAELPPIAVPALAAIERIAGAKPLMAEFTRHVPAERAERHPLGRRELDRAGEIFAVGAKVQEVRRPIEVYAERPIGPSVGELGVKFVEACDRFCDVAIERNAAQNAIRTEACEEPVT